MARPSLSSSILRKRDDFVQMHAIGRSSVINKADSAFGICPATAPVHSLGHTDGASPFKNALIAFQYNSKSASGPYLQNSRGMPSSPGALPFGCLRLHLSSVSKPTGRFNSGGVPAGILRISASTCSGIGQGGIGDSAGSSQTDWHCSQKNRTALVGLPNLWWVAVVLITCRPFA